MDQLPATWTALCALAFVLGARHGFDADHLATIDGLTRYNARTNPALARFCGALFSLDTAWSCAASPVPPHR
jgi:high-affinity nickel-transport protein